nr:uncharacterized protein LOC109149028 [Ipomoea batatas]
MPKTDPSGLEKETDNREGKTKESESSRTAEEQRLMEETDAEEVGIAHLSNEEIEILMENGFKESIYLLRTQHQAAMAALRSIKLEKGQSMKSESKENHRPLDGGNFTKQRELSEEHQSIPIGPISDKYKEVIEKMKIGQNLDINSEESFPELKGHQPLDGGLAKDDGGFAKEKGVKFVGETTYYYERGQPSGTKQDQGSEAETGKESGNKGTFREAGVERGRNIRRESGEGIRERSSSGERRTQYNWQYQGRGGNQIGRGGRGGRFGRGRGYQNNLGGRGVGVENQSGIRVQSELGKEKGKQKQMEGESAGRELEKEKDLEELRRAIEGGKEKEREKEMEMERQREVEKLASDLPEKQNLEGVETSEDEGKPTAVIGGAYGILGQVDEEGNEIEKINENEIDPGPDESEHCEAAFGIHDQFDMVQGLSMRPGIKDRPVWKPTGVNWAVGRDGLKCGFFARNSKGGFCVAGVYLLQDGGSMGDLVKSMLRDCWSWCWKEKIRRLIVESSDWQWLDDGDLSRFSEEVQVVVNQCTERVNCVADCFVNACANVNVIYIKKDALPRGIGRVLALEGVPHFVFVPGLDFS